jgi:preprotein translocase subunit SecG
MGPFQILLFVVWAVSAVALTILVLMHSGKGTGVSDMIASSLYNSSSATGVMEQNLDRLTVIMAVVFAVSFCACSSSRRASWATKLEPHKYLKRVPQVRDPFCLHICNRVKISSYTSPN